MRLFLSFLFVSLVFTGPCPADETVYTHEINQWHAERLASLKKPAIWIRWGTLITTSGLSFSPMKQAAMGPMVPADFCP